MSFGRFEDSSQTMPVMAEINMTPLVDVMLVLVVMLILSAPLLTQAIRLDLPKTAPMARQAAAATPPITLSLDAQGQVFWDDTPITDPATLVARLQDTARRHPEAEVQLRADQQVRYQALAALLTQLQQAGIQKIGFITAPAAPGSPAAVPQSERQP